MPYACHKRNHGLLAFRSSCLRLAAARSLALSGLGSRSAYRRSSNSISEMVCSESIWVNNPQRRLPRQLWFKRAGESGNAFAHGIPQKRMASLMTVRNNRQHVGAGTQCLGPVETLLRSSLARLTGNRFQRFRSVAMPVFSRHRHYFHGAPVVRKLFAAAEAHHIRAGDRSRSRAPAPSLHRNREAVIAMGTAEDEIHNRSNHPPPPGNTPLMPSLNRAYHRRVSAGTLAHFNVTLRCRIRCLSFRNQQ